MSNTYFEIDRRRKESVDVQLFNTITQAIQNQLIPQNTPLSIEVLQQLAPELEESRIIEILDEIVSNGIARKSKNAYFSLARKVPSVTYHKLEALHDLLQNHYDDVREVISEVALTKHYPKKQKDAEFKDREPLFMVQRKYYADNELIAFSNTYLPVKIFKDIELLDFNQGTLYQLLEKHYPEYSFEYSRRLSSVIPSTIYVSGVLEVTRNTPVYYGRIHSFTKRYKQFEYSDVYVLANRFNFSTEYSTTELKKLL
jgi:GntR family transcriptional regulator